MEESIRLVKRGEKEYPGRLSALTGAPKELYVWGRMPVEELPSVAVIGARDCSEYGRYVAEKLGSFFGRNGVQVISGMARGIDGMAQEAAVNAGGSSFGVLGSGVDVCYPASNRALYEKLKEAGGIMSEYPPGTPAYSWNFPPRNRIVSGLADAVIVVEARAKSGTLITVDMALEQGKEVYVVPGRVTDILSAGCNRLMKLGAGILLEPEDFLEELREIHKRMRRLGEAGDECAKEKHKTEVLRREIKSLKTEKEEESVTRGEQQAAQRLSSECEAILRVLDFYPQSVEQILKKLPKKYQSQPIQVPLIRLCMEQLAVQAAPGYFCLAGEGRDGRQ